MNNCAGEQISAITWIILYSTFGGDQQISAIKFTLAFI
jgi:hypothetical protein